MREAASSSCIGTGCGGALEGSLPSATERLATFVSTLLAWSPDRSLRFVNRSANCPASPHGLKPLRREEGTIKSSKLATGSPPAVKLDGLTTLQLNSATAQCPRGRCNRAQVRLLTVERGAWWLGRPEDLEPVRAPSDRRVPRRRAARGFRCLNTAAWNMAAGPSETTMATHSKPRSEWEHDREC